MGSVSGLSPCDSTHASGTYKREEGYSPSNSDPVVITLKMDDTCEVHLLAKFENVFDLRIAEGTWMKCASTRTAPDEAMVSSEQAELTIQIKVTYQYNDNDFTPGASNEPPAYCTTSMYVRVCFHEIVLS